MRQILIDVLGPDWFDELMTIMAVGLPLSIILVMVLNWGSGGVLVPLLGQGHGRDDKDDHNGLTAFGADGVGGDGGD